MEERLMHQITGKDALARVAPLFQNWEETLIWTALEGNMGGIWAADGAEECPRAALCRTFDFAFFAGDAETPEAETLMRALRTELAGGYAILTPQNEAWDALIVRVFGAEARPCERYAICKEGDCFDRARLQGFIDALDKELSLAVIDDALYERVMAEDWSRDFCATFGSAEAFAAHGLGVVALCGGELAGGAASYIYYDHGIEIEVDTREDFRRRGIAAACCAKLILLCLERGLYPSWDAANRSSVALAEKLGYREKGAYRSREVGMPAVAPPVFEAKPVQ
ncbi:MAG: GNAT family N-acetyltransferase [Clostridia bacterium]